MYPPQPTNAQVTYWLIIGPPFNLINNRFSVVGYCASVNKAHVHEVNVHLNRAMRIILWHWYGNTASMAQPVLCNNRLAPLQIGRGEVLLRYFSKVTSAQNPSYRISYGTLANSEKYLNDGLPCWWILIFFLKLGRTQTCLTGWMEQVSSVLVQQQYLVFEWQ